MNNEKIAKKMCTVMVIAAIHSSVHDACAEEKNRVDYAEMSLEQLMNIEVTSVSKKQEAMSETAAAVSVLTSDDIRRSGALTIPDALRYLPGVQVARQDAHQWAVSSRGFNDIFANKLLVMVDGRSIYTPLFSGVFWNTTDVFIEDLDRIEVVRGPGATVWGANAVNGVISIISKSAKDTQGWLVTGGSGTEEPGFGGVRYGGTLGEDVYFRIYGKYFLRDDSQLANGDNAYDSWQQGRGGIRLDWEASPLSQLTLQSEIFGNREHQQYQLPSLLSPYSEIERDHQGTEGGHLLGRWTQELENGSDLALQAYYDVTRGTYVILEETRKTSDIDFQYRFDLGERHELVWGLGCRTTSDDIENMPWMSVTPDHRTDNLLSAFLQDEYALVPDRLKVAVGSKFEHNDFTGYEVQPSVRLEWTPAKHQTAWAAISRAVRTPSRVDEGARISMQPLPPDFLFPGSPVTLPQVVGSKDFDSEELLAYELGFRTSPHQCVHLDTTLFYHDYNNLRTSSPQAPELSVDPLPPHLVVSSSINNEAEGESYGVELAAIWQAEDWWRLTGSYTLMNVETRATSLSSQNQYIDEGGTAPRHQISIWSRMDLPRAVEFDMGLRYVDALSSTDIDEYLTMDVHLGWNPSENLEFSLVGSSLLDSQYPEWSPTYIQSQSTEVERSVYGKVTWRFL